MHLSRISRVIAAGLIMSALAGVPEVSARGTVVAQVVSAAQIPQQLSPDDRAYYVDVFNLIDAEDWPRVTGLLSSRSTGPLHQVALAEYYLHPRSPKIELDALNQWLAMGRDLPQAAQIGRLAIKRGLENAPELPGMRTLVSLRTPAKRIRPGAIADGTMPEATAQGIFDRITNDDPAGARALLDGVDAMLSSDARAEWRQRVAWSHYIENDDRSALELARNVANGGTGPWVAEGWWVAGLSAWRLGDCALSADGFSRSAQEARNDELRAAAHYWAARSFTRCRQPELAAPALRNAALMNETLYGMLAADQLGMTLPTHHAGAAFSSADWQQLADEANVRTAVALVEIGRDGLADEVLRHQAEIGDAKEYDVLVRLARSLGLPGAQLYMAYHAPRGARPEPAARYPVTRWAPVDGWRIDPALVYAHTLQESNFRPEVVSPAGATGLMQLMPATARRRAEEIPQVPSNPDLTDPAINMALGQRNLEALRDSASTQALLPKIIAAYNAGLSPVSRWNTEIRDFGDPLLWMESIPYWETRGYVAIVMRNYWMYERQRSSDSSSRDALTQNLWPRFPGTMGAVAYAMHGKPVTSKGGVRGD